MRGGWWAGRGRRPRFYHVTTQRAPIEPCVGVSQRSPRTGCGSSGRRAAHQARIRSCGAPPVGIRTARNRPVTTKWRHTASEARARLHTAPPDASGPLGARRWRPGTAPAAAEPHRRTAVAPKGLVMMSNKICMLCMWSLPRSRSAAVAPIGPRRVLIARCPLAASAADRNPGRDHICFMLGSMARPLGATPLRRRGSAAAGAVPGRMPLLG